MPDSNTPRSIEDRDALIEACAKGDRAAFAELFSYYAPRVKAFLMRLQADNAMAEELAQEVLLTVWRKAELFDRSQASASTWIFRIARNKRIDAARRAAKPDLDPEEPALRPEALEAPDDAVHGRDRDAKVREAVSHLPDEQKTLLKLAFFDGLSHSEIAEISGLPLGTVKSRLRLAFSKLRRFLEPDDL